MNNDLLSKLRKSQKDQEKISQRRKKLEILTGEREAEEITLPTKEEILSRLDILNHITEPREKLKYASWFEHHNISLFCHFGWYFFFPELSREEIQTLLEDMDALKAQMITISNRLKNFDHEPIWSTQLKCYTLKRIEE